MVRSWRAIKCHIYRMSYDNNNSNEGINNKPLLYTLYIHKRTHKNHTNAHVTCVDGAMAARVSSVATTFSRHYRLMNYACAVHRIDFKCGSRTQGDGSPRASNTRAPMRYCKLTASNIIDIFRVRLYKQASN